jgi:hypothetical protein
LLAVVRPISHFAFEARRPLARFFERRLLMQLAWIGFHYISVWHNFVSRFHCRNQGGAASVRELSIAWR